MFLHMHIQNNTEERTTLAMLIPTQWKQQCLSVLYSAFHVLSGTFPLTRAG